MNITNLQATAAMYWQMVAMIASILDFLSTVGDINLKEFTYYNGLANGAIN